MKISTALTVATVSISTMAVAQTERDLDSHEHGAASLNIAIDDQAVFLELESPWNNLVGFEHEPKTPEQHALIDDAMALLNQPDRLFSFEGTDCTVAELDLQSGIAGDEEGEHGHDEHEDEHDEHEDEHAEHEDEHAEHEDEHDEHEDEHAEHEDEHAEHEHDDHADDESGTHSSIFATYVFNCTDVTQLNTIDVTLLDIWSGFEDLDVQLIGPGGQGLVELGQQQSVVDVTQVQ